MCCPLNCSALYFVSRSSLNILCIIYPSESSSWNTPKPMLFEILKYPYLFWSSFFEGQFEWIFSFSNNTLSLTFNSCRFSFFLSNCLFIFFWASSINFVASSQLCCSLVRNSSNFRNFICVTRLPFYECLPKLSLNRICSVTVCFLSLYWNSAAASYSVQLSCW